MSAHLDVPVYDGGTLCVHGSHGRAGGKEHLQYLLGGQNCELQHCLQWTSCKHNTMVGGFKSWSGSIGEALTSTRVCDNCME